MDHAANLMLIAGVLLAAGALSSRLSTRSGVPLALLFVAIGLFAGKEGPLGLPFDDAALASGISVGLLALILFDGGLSTPAGLIRRVAAPALALATVGVIVTALVIAAVAVYVLGFPWLQGLLLGSVLGSTDAAAVFAAFRGRGVTLPGRVRAVLEVESGINDPIAVFLTVTLTAMLAGTGVAPGGWEVARIFAVQMSVGIGIGVGVGWGAGRLMRVLHLDIAGLYFVLTLATALLAFGGAHALGGSGIIAVYVAGVMVGHARLPFEHGVRRFHDGIAWIAQVGIFVLLGLLATPSRLILEAPSGIALATALILVARPLAVLVTTAPFGYHWRDQLLIACGGLRGAVPVVLATIPLAAGLPDANRIFHLVFFAVLLSALVQGTSLNPLARRLGRTEPAAAEPPVSLELTALRETGQELLGYGVERASVADGKAVRDLPLPIDALITLLVRESEAIAPRGSTVLRAGDQIYVLHKAGGSRVIAAVVQAQAPDEATSEDAAQAPLPLDARIATVGDFGDFYGVSLGPDRDQILAECLSEQLGRSARAGETIDVPGLRLRVLTVIEGQPHQVSVEISGA
ncbi:MAG: potassium/proton antiporter [Gemmatimonadota bacterium]